MGGEDAETYLRMLHDIAANESESTRCRIQAIQLLLARGWGAEPQQVDVEVTSPMSATELRASLKAAGLLNQPRESETAELAPAWRDRMNRWVAGDDL